MPDTQLFLVSLLHNNKGCFLLLSWVIVISVKPMIPVKPVVHLYWPTHFHYTHLHYTPL
uniref:Uncharacterized protein n=1 Tax=Anguilla anguilla TaxID=7936 RepID=A0A0E9WDD5_ANGAN